MKTTDVRPGYLCLGVAALGLTIAGFVALCSVVWLRDVARPKAVLTDETERERQGAITDSFYGKDRDASGIEVIQIHATLDKLRRAIADKDITEIGNHIDGEMTLAAIEQQGGSVPNWRRAHLRNSLPGLLAKEQSLSTWQSHEVKRVRFLESRNELVAYVRLRFADGSTSKLRWWLTKRSSAWRVYDYEALEFGVRLSTIVALLTTENSSVLEPRQALATFVQAGG